MKYLVNEDVRLNEYGQVDVDFYIARAKRLRNQAIANQLVRLGGQVKTLIKPEESLAANIKTA